MVELLLKLIDRVIDLKKYQADRLKKAVESDLDPVFDELMAVHGDYVRMFEDALAQLMAIEDSTTTLGRQKLAAAAEALRHRRLEFEPVRAKIMAMSAEMGRSIADGSSNWGCREAEQFVRDTMEYLPRGNLGDGKSRATTLLALLYGASVLTPDQMHRHGAGLPPLIRATIDECRSKWDRVCVSYAQLKTAVREAQ